MKVDSKHIIEAFSELKSVIEGINETVQEWGAGDAESTILSSTETLKVIIGTFWNQYLTPVVKEIKRDHPFLGQYERISDKKIANESLTESENKTYFKAQFYLFLRKSIRAVELPKIIDRETLGDFIYREIVAPSDFEYYFRTEFLDDAVRIMDLVAEEIVEEFKKHPQLGLFDSPDKTDLPKDFLIDKM